MITTIAKDLINMIEKYKEVTSKTDYHFTYDEQVAIQRAILSLDKHIDLLITYEIDRAKKENK